MDPLGQDKLGNLIYRDDYVLVDKWSLRVISSSPDPGNIIVEGNIQVGLGSVILDESRSVRIGSAK